MHFHQTAINMQLNYIQFTLIFIILKHIISIISTLLTYVNVFFFIRAMIYVILFFNFSYLKKYNLIACASSISFITFVI